jgi:ADP-heptose:LPS heptosyltransferase
VKKVLIISLGPVRDVVHTLPALDVLRRAFPLAKIGWLVEDAASPLLEGHPEIDFLYTVPISYWKQHWLRVFGSEILPFLRDMRGQEWEASLDFHGTTRSGILAIASGADIRVGFGKPDEKRTVQKWWTTLRVQPPAKARHGVERNLALLSALRITPPATHGGGNLSLPESDLEAARKFFRECEVAPGREIVGFVPGADTPTRQWRSAAFIALGEILWHEARLKPLVLWRLGEEALRDEILEGLRRRGVNVIPTPPLDLRGLAAFARQVAVVVGGDCGLTHLAAYEGVPTVALYGPTDGRNHGPWGPKTTLLQKTDLPCIRCGKTQCPQTRAGKEELPCMDRIIPAEVARAARELLAQSNP